MSDSNDLCKAWSLLSEYDAFCRLARHRKKLEEQLNSANIPLTHVPWKSMVHNLFTQQLFYDQQLQEMNEPSTECCTTDAISQSQAMVNILLENYQEDEKCLTETWFEIDELKHRFQQAIDIIPASRHERKEMLYKIMGYPKDYCEEEIESDLHPTDDKPFDFTHVLSTDEQRQMRTGDLIELSGYRLHDAFYVYRLPQKGIWAQVKQMWLKHQITDFVFNSTEPNAVEEEIILVPAMDEYGYGVPYLFAKRSTELLPPGALHKYVDINCPLVAMHAQNPTIALVQRHIGERLENPIYNDSDIGVEMTVKPDRFPQEYVAYVQINDGPTDNVGWTQRVHYNGKNVATDLNDNADIFFSRRILEAEDQYRQKHSHTSTPDISSS